MSILYNVKKGVRLVCRSLPSTSLSTFRYFKDLSYKRVAINTIGKIY